jgi:hypothetical protein
MSFGNVIFTDKGRILQARAQLGELLTFSKIQIGDGELGGRSIQALTSLINPKKDIAITNMKKRLNTAIIGGVLNNSQITTGFYWRELGLFAIDSTTQAEILYCYGNAGNLAEYIAAGNGNNLLEKRIDIVAAIGNATNVTAVLETSDAALVVIPENTDLPVSSRKNGKLYFKVTDEQDPLAGINLRMGQKFGLRVEE